VTQSVVVTGSSGLIGSAVVEYLNGHGYSIIGIDNNMRQTFFGEQGSTRSTQQRLIEQVPGFRHVELDILDRHGVAGLIDDIQPAAIVHTAAQPSHDRAATIPFLDFEVNALGTLNLLEAARNHCADSPFIHMSTNKVYGDRPNFLPIQELDTRWDFEAPIQGVGIDESMSIDQTKHSLFGASKAAADLMVQEYGRYFSMPTVCLRGGCLTGPQHKGVELHGFLSYLVKASVEGFRYRIFGYQGKQVRDNIHSTDVARFILQFIQKPRVAEVYNIGGGFANTVSILEAFAKIEQLSGKPMDYEYVDEARIGDHIVYYSDLEKMKSHYPEWDITVGIDEVFEDLYTSATG
jgi:CDP-paratose 2-epimerase